MILEEVEKNSTDIEDKPLKVLMSLIKASENLSSEELERINKNIYLLLTTYVTILVKEKKIKTNI